MLSFLVSICIRFEGLNRSDKKDNCYQIMLLIIEKIRFC